MMDCNVNRYVAKIHAPDDLRSLKIESDMFYIDCNYINLQRVQRRDPFCVVFSIFQLFFIQNVFECTRESRGGNRGSGLR